MTLNCTLHFKCADQTLPTQAGEYLCIKRGGQDLATPGMVPKHPRFNAYDLLPDCPNAIKVDWWSPVPHWAIS